MTATSRVRTPAAGRVAAVHAASRLPVVRIGGFGSTERTPAGRRAARDSEHDPS